MVTGKDLPGGSEKTSEFKRYQQALAVFYLTVIGAGTLLLAASVVRELFFRPVVQPDPYLQDTIDSAWDPARLLQCHQKVNALYEQLAEQANELIHAPPRRPERDLISAWASFAQTWRHQWETVNGWCQFSTPQDFSDTSQGEAYDRLAHVHAKLFALELKYQSLLARFDTELAADLIELQRALDRSRRLLAGDAIP